MLTGEELAGRRAECREAPDLGRGVEAMRVRLARLLEESPPLPTAKALLSRAGGVCPADGVTLVFDPWSAREHSCPRCGARRSGERHDRAWARWQHLWLAERAADLAAMFALAADDRARDRALEIVLSYASRYAEFPNVDNVLGPARVLFSTYLESIWLDNLMSAAFMLGEGGALDGAAVEAVGRLAEEAANLIGEYDERLSNRQVWNNAALLSVAVWFEDEQLAHRCIEGPTGLISHLIHGFGPDGLWFEGENYHSFALQGMIRAAGWARLAGVDVFAEPELTGPLHRALMAPAATALPDLTYPARKDSRYGVSLAQPMFLESWEIALGRATASQAGPPDGLAGWLAQLYRRKAPPAQRFDSYLHEEAPPPLGERARADLSWRALLEMLPELPAEGDRVGPDDAGSTGSVLESAGLAILRPAGNYVALECGGGGSGGHGHPDRLNLSLHTGGRHWLPDPGTASYVTDDLHYYRSTVAHNAPLLDGRSQASGIASACSAFAVEGDWGWLRGSWGAVTRTVVAGPDQLLDLVDSAADDEHLVELPWHLNGSIEVLTPGNWVPGELDHPGTGGHRRFQPESRDARQVSVRVVAGERILHVVFGLTGELWSVTGPGLPAADLAGESVEFLLLRGSGRHVRYVAVMSWGGPVSLEADGDLFQVAGEHGATRHQAVTGGWQIDRPDSQVRLAGLRTQAAEYRPLVLRDKPLQNEAQARFMAETPGFESGEGFRDVDPLMLDHEDQYRRAELPYEGADSFSAAARPGWNREAFYLALEVTKERVWFRAPDSAPLDLDNEPDDIHSDGAQVYLAGPSGAVLSLVAVPDPASAAVAVRIASGHGSARGRWQETHWGYRMILEVVPEWWPDVVPGDHIGFDVIVNEGYPDRTRRAGQLVWTGRGGWVWLRGDRQDPADFGTLVLA